MSGVALVIVLILALLAGYAVRLGQEVAKHEGAYGLAFGAFLIALVAVTFAVTYLAQETTAP